MKAIVQDTYGSSDVLSLRDIATPEVGEKEVLLRVHASALHIGDWHLMTGLPYLLRLGFGLRGPRTSVRGMDVAGTVEAVGKGVTEFQPGDAVFGVCDGALAEYARARVDRILHKPSNLTFEQAAAVPTSATTALQALREQGQVQPGQKVLVIGAGGGVGLFAVQLAKVFGAHVTGVCSTKKMELVRSIGADEVIDYTRQDFSEQGGRYDLILDTAGNRELSLLRRALAPQGTLVLVGGEAGGRWFGGLERNLQALMLAPLVNQKLRGLVALTRKQDLVVLKELIEAGKVTPVIDREFPLSQGREAVRYFEEGRARGKVVVTSAVA
jgi:NADPH:quinone reductase-like Zn-dependent oxidoreductase